MNILVTLDRNYLPPLRVMLGSLLRNDPGETFEIYAIGDGLLPEDWTALEELCAGRGHIHPLEVPADLFADAPVARYWTRAMYYRLLAAELLPRSLDQVRIIQGPDRIDYQNVRVQIQHPVQRPDGRRHPHRAAGGHHRPGEPAAAGEL